MTIDVTPEVERQLRSKAKAEGLSLGAYVERLISEEDSRQTKLESFQREIAERVASLDRGDSVDGEEVMDRLIGDLGATGPKTR